ncbi:MAG: thioredoxin family protein [Pontiellaceae bacterium]|jgi:thioredoxin 1|nr:thioredoxin family protein [Pontiellaceae bacterium]
MNKWQKLLVVIALIGAVAFVVEHKKKQGFACAGGICPLPSPDEASSVSPVVEPVAQQTAPLPKLLDLGAGHCVPCRMMTPILDELKITYAGKLDVVFIDVLENKEAGEQYRIRTIPTQIFFDAEGKELFRHEGFFAKEDILVKWQELGINLSNE